MCFALIDVFLAKEYFFSSISTSRDLRKPYRGSKWMLILATYEHGSSLTLKFVFKIWNVFSLFYVSQKEYFFVAGSPFCLKRYKKHFFHSRNNFLSQEVLFFFSKKYFLFRVELLLYKKHFFTEILFSYKRYFLVQEVFSFAQVLFLCKEVLFIV